MIIRSFLKCLTCGQAHIVRIGMGQEDTQEHHFPCDSCREPIHIKMNIDYHNISTEVVCVENSELIPSTEEKLPIRNLDANFLIPEEDKGADFTFSRLKQLAKIITEADKSGMIPLSKHSGPIILGSPIKRPEYWAEWKLLKKCWSLKRNQREKLSDRKLEEGSVKLYPKEPLQDIYDWQTRLMSNLGGFEYEKKFQTIIKSLTPVWQSEDLVEFKKRYEDEMVITRGNHYFEILKDFFSSYDEFSQVIFLVNSGIDIDVDNQTSSVNFETTKMFYGNVFEIFSRQVELLAMMNNMILGRKHDQFGKLTLNKYRKLDNSSRCTPFGMNVSFTEISAEFDNQLRNASHHKSFQFSEKDQLISYGTGKGGTGEEQTISYSEYLRRCTRLFLQTITLFRVELVTCKKLGMKRPF